MLKWMMSCWCRKLAEDESCCIESQGMAGLQDKLFVLNYKKGLETLRQRHIEAIVRERFGIVGEGAAHQLIMLALTIQASLLSSLVGDVSALLKNFYYMCRHACLQDAAVQEAAGAEANRGLCHGACAGGARGPVQDAPGRLPRPPGPHSVHLNP